ncbi:MAG: pyridoxamine 5'-phosphate oxidase family protein [Pseudomonadota bacterium]
MEQALDELLADVWARLVRGAADKRAPFNRPAIATVSEAGGPEVRTVVLRTVTPSRRLLAFHTDMRSAKIAALRHKADVAWHFWDPRAQIQVRVSAKAAFHHADDISRAAWAKLHDGSKRTYAQRAIPGAAVSDPAVAADETIPLDDAAANFAAVMTTATSIDYLHLARKGHRRAIWHWRAQQQDWAGAWVGA